MFSTIPSRARRVLRSPRTITAELGLVVLAGLAASLVDQHPTPFAQVRLSILHPVGAWLIHHLQLDRVLSARWFLGVVAVATCSLAIVVWEQWGRVRREWRKPLEVSFRGAPYRRETLRPSSGRGRLVRVESHGRIGVLGSPLFHTGLLVVALSGMARMLFGANAAREVVERQVIATTAEAFQVQDLGPLAGPVILPTEVRFVELVPAYYPSGGLLGLSSRVEMGSRSDRWATLAVNAPLSVGPVELYLTQSFGPAALLDLGEEGGPQLALLAPGETSDYEWAGPLPGGLELRLRAPGKPEARPPQLLDVRVLQAKTLLAAGRLAPGGSLSLPGGRTIGLLEIRWWVTILAARDPTVWPIFAGFAVAIAGVILMFAVTRVDVMVQVEPADAGEKVTVAMRPRRLAPLYAERFERLVQRELGKG
jgi:cytochrome c biogenesis protein ResB